MDKVGDRVQLGQALRHGPVARRVVAIGGEQLDCGESEPPAHLGGPGRPETAQLAEVARCDGAGAASVVAGLVAGGADAQLRPLRPPLPAARRHSPLADAAPYRGEPFGGRSSTASARSGFTDACFACGTSMSTGWVSAPLSVKNRGVAQAHRAMTAASWLRSINSSTAMSPIGEHARRRGQASG
jgi:hypothetical protein